MRCPRAFAASVRTINPWFGEAVDRLVERLKTADVGASAPDEGDLLPPFYLPDEDGRIVSLPELLESGAGRGRRPSPARVPILPDQHAGSCPGPSAHRGRRRSACGDGPRSPALCRDDPRRGRSEFSSPHGHGQRIRHVAQSRVLGGIGDANPHGGGGDRPPPEYQGNESWMVPVPATFVVGRDGKIKGALRRPRLSKAHQPFATVQGLAKKTGGVRGPR